MRFLTLSSDQQLPRGGSVEVGNLRALSGSDGSELFAVTDTALLINTASSIAVGDIDLDGRPEILAYDTSGIRLIAFEHNGTFKWRSPNLEAIYFGAPSITDLDSDGTPEIVIRRQVLNNDGSIRWTGAGGRGSQANVGPVSLVADINMDGSPDVVAGNTVYTAIGAWVIADVVTTPIPADLYLLGSALPFIAFFRRKKSRSNKV